MDAHLPARAYPALRLFDLSWNRRVAAKSRSWRHPAAAGIGMWARRCGARTSARLWSVPAAPQPLANVDRLVVPKRVVSETLLALQEFGQHGCEGFLLWTGTIQNQTAEVQRVLVPPQESLKSEDGVGYFVTAETSHALNLFLARNQVRLIAQVHSHPGTAYHSHADDRYALVTTNGGFSLVVPNFGMASTTLHDWAAFRLVKARWVEVPASRFAKMVSLAVP